MIWVVLAVQLALVVLLSVQVIGHKKLMEARDLREREVVELLTQAATQSLSMVCQSNERVHALFLEHLRRTQTVGGQPVEHAIAAFDEARARSQSATRNEVLGAAMSQSKKTAHAAAGAARRG